MEIPQENSREEVKLRDQIIEDLQDYILVKYLSITETAEKAVC